jgi:hypothetical protein
MKKIFLSLLCAGLFNSCNSYAALTVKVVNTLDVNRSGETVEVPWDAVLAGIGEVTPQEVAVFTSS